MPVTQSTRETPLRILFGGDVMLGRNVGQSILRFGVDYPLGPLAPLTRQADLAIVNLECAITSTTSLWRGAQKAFYFGAPPEAAGSLLRAGIDLVSLANNHSLDYDVKGLLHTLRFLRRAGISCAGAGRGIEEATRPAIIECRGIRIGMAAFCDHQADFAAGRNAPGIAYLNLDDEPAALDAWRKALESLQRDGVHWPVLSLHWGPNMVWRPSERFRRLAHGAIDMGWKILFGHSAHVFHGIEIYRDCPIIYAAGDLVDDYYVDPDFSNDHQLLFEVQLDDAAVSRIELHPVFIAGCQARLANGTQAEKIIGRMTALCAAMGTIVHRQKGKFLIQ